MKKHDVFEYPIQMGYWERKIKYILIEEGKIQK